MKDGTCVAIPAVPVPGVSVGLWICDAIEFPSKPLKVTLTSKVLALRSKMTMALPVGVMNWVGIRLVHHGCSTFFR